MGASKADVYSVGHEWGVELCFSPELRRIIDRSRGRDVRGDSTVNYHQASLPKRVRVTPISLTDVLASVLSSLWQRLKDIAGCHRLSRKPSGYLLPQLL